ncbi:hypothetical protein, partial [Streptococcus pneumoniae]|uniref:hypothetical protein n=1 Tax=Streptococcus pneumoniae TaxID=1313 RepID=UPI0018B0A5A0
DWDFDEGEKEALRARGAIALDHACGSVVFEGREYVDACPCWNERAAKIVAFIESYSKPIAAFLTLEKKRKEQEAKDAPEVD